MKCHPCEYLGMYYTFQRQLEKWYFKIIQCCLESVKGYWGKVIKPRKDAGLVPMRGRDACEGLPAMGVSM